MRRFLLLSLLCLAGTAASAAQPVPSSIPYEDAAVQATLDSFAKAWLAGDRQALERILHEDYLYIRGVGEGANTWDRDAEIRMASGLAEAGTVQTLTVTATRTAPGPSAGQIQVVANLEFGLVLPSGERSASSRELVFTMLWREDGLRIWRQLDEKAVQP